VSNIRTVKRLAIFKLRPRGGGPNSTKPDWCHPCTSLCAMCSATRNTTAHRRPFVFHQPASLSFICFIRPLHSVSIFRSLFGDALEFFYLLVVPWLRHQPAPHKASRSNEQGLITISSPLRSLASTPHAQCWLGHSTDLQISQVFIYSGLPRLAVTSNELIAT
jgi:hypothetical protein